MKANEIPSITTAPYGTWKSPITPEKIAEGSTSISNMFVDGTDTYWNEMRPSNKGRYTIVKCDIHGNLTDMTKPDFNARTFVHEYGGGSFAVKDGIIYASNSADHKIYIIEPGKSPNPLTEGQIRVSYDGQDRMKGCRFANLHPIKKGLIAVGEEHIPGKEVENFLAFIDFKTGQVHKIATGYDFYSALTVSRDERKVAWVCWNHPNMPWNDTELWTADLDEEGGLHNSQRIAGEIPESIFQPGFSADGTLYFISDRDTGWWNMYRYSQNTIEKLFHIEAELGEPLWVFERSTWAFLGEEIVFTYTQSGTSFLGILNPHTKEWRQIPTEGVYYNQLRSGRNCVRMIEYFVDKPEALVELQNQPGNPIVVLHTERQAVEKKYLTTPEHITYDSNGRKTFAFFYPPQNGDFKAPEGEKPPLVVMIHGGPTSQAKNYFSLHRQYWTSRGFAVIDVNYGGSTGYGRKYRYALNYNWGVVDVEDCVNGSLYLADKGLVDRNKLIIRGGSAGGYTTLAALAFTDVFKAGGDYYGVADLTALATDTHKFESRYNDLLVGKYPEDKEIWDQRSPINYVDNITAPLIIFQGEDDAIVPKNQSIMIYEALKKKGIMTEMYIYPGEEHGFRQAKHIIDSLEKETDFYLRVFGLI